MGQQKRGVDITKKCLKCEQIKPSHEFCKNKYKKDGLNNYCKQCECKRVGEYYDSHKKERKTYRESRKEEINTYNLLFYDQNRDREKLRVKKYRKANREVIRKKQKERYDNPNGQAICKTYDNHYWRYAYGQLVHRVIAGKVLGRTLRKNECVHYVDFNGLNNTFNNLLICTNGFHAYLHRLIDKKRKHV